MNTADLIEKAEKIAGFLRKGYSKERIKEELDFFSDEIFSIALARIKNARLNKIDQRFVFDEAGLRFATSDIVARHRAKRLKCKIIVDVCCGIGIQAIALARICKKVIAIDNDKSKIRYARMNAGIAGVKNIQFIAGDAVKILDRIKSADVIFWDPLRPASEKERSVSSFSPSFDVLLSKAGKISDNICVELPPQMLVGKIKESCELEYLSFNHKLCRLSAYFGRLKMCGVSAVCLETGARLEADSPEKIVVSGAKLNRFLYDIDRAVVKAGLIPALIRSIKKKIEVVCLDDIQYLTSDTLLKNDFLTAFKVVASVSVRDARAFLISGGFGKCILRGRIAKEDYWKIRGGLEKGLTGEKTAHVFIAGSSAVVCINSKVQK